MKPRKPRLFSYIVREDSGAAPNPFGGVCSLVICKPRIRSAATEGDWIVGTGSVSSSAGDLSNRVVYAMRVTKAMSLADYDVKARRDWPEKLPDPCHPEQPRRTGDCIYDFSTDPPRQRAGAHEPEDAERDLSGRQALISEEFWYFGATAPELPPELRAIVSQRQGHRSNLNAPYLNAFIKWIRTLPPGIQGTPAETVPRRKREQASTSRCSGPRAAQ